MVEIIAHRGARSIAPENTLAAARIAHASGAHCWETDVSITMDGHLVLFHDLTLSRCTDAPKVFGYDPGLDPVFNPGAPIPMDGQPPKEALLNQYLLMELECLDAGSYFMETDPFLTIGSGELSRADAKVFAGESIPTLAQGLALTRDLKWKINIELKDHGTEPEPYYTASQTMAAIGTAGLSNKQFVISSFNHDWLNWLSFQAPEVEIQALVGDRDDEPLDFGNFSFPVYNVNANIITEDGVRDLKARSKKVNLFTVNDPRDVDRFIKAGADGIITDFPQNYTQG